ncbi:hypothetical protein [Nitrososphaeria virus YSH_922147]|uniref:Uncharacterized protein n=1 Tax=Nitrososphaeria virus YSH_922147 TaxID=3071323 RepID=A0A976YF87_9CAUD|nr:hypothetical protein QKV94_gp18 [Yangshan Harbor Nitrososphaeria virus]UVF62427.1 hypothetical protein [Nitrososphaeria virus YSH_922147]
MDHLTEWKAIKHRYENMEQSPQIKYRIERISHLIKEAETKEFNHFK